MIKVKLIVMALCAVWTFQAGAEFTFIDGVAAVVDSNPVTVSEVKAAAKVLSEMGNRDTTCREALEYMVDMNILEKEAGERGLKVTDEEVETAIKAVATRNNFSYRQLKEVIEAKGIPFSVYRNIVKYELLKDRFIRSVIQPETMVGPSDVRALYSELHKQGLRPVSVVVFVGRNRKQVSKARLLLTEEKDFKHVNQEFPEVVSTPIKNVWPEDLNPQVKTVLQNLKPGEMSDIFQIGEKWGFVLFTGLDDNDSAQKIPPEVYSRLEQMALLKKINEELKRKLARFRTKHFVEFLQVPGCEEPLANNKQ